MPEPASSAYPPGGGAADHADTKGAPAAASACLLVTHVHPDGDRIMVKVCGELDIDTSETFRGVLREALSRSVRGIDLDLGGVSFCDCSALNVLLTLRHRALEQEKTVTIHSTSTAADRLLDLTGTRTLFADPGPDRQGTQARHTRDADVSGATDEDLRIEVAQLRRAMQTRPTIDLARGILMASFSLSSDEAWSVLVAASQNTNTKLHALAGDLVTAVKGDALPEAVQEQLSSAVARINASSSARINASSSASQDGPEEPESTRTAS